MFRLARYDQKPQNTATDTNSQYSMDLIKDAKPHPHLTYILKVWWYIRSKGEMTSGVKDRGRGVEEIVGRETAETAKKKKILSKRIVCTFDYCLSEGSR